MRVSAQAAASSCRTRGADDCMTVGSWPSGFSAHTGTIYIAIPAYRSTILRLFLEIIIDKTFETEVVRSW